LKDKEMKIDEYHDITTKLGQTMSFLEDLETILIDRFGDRCHSAVWMRLTSCYLVLSSLHLSQEYNERFADGQGGWSLTE
jgi:hypothetical protein